MQSRATVRRVVSNFLLALCVLAALIALAGFASGVAVPKFPGPASGTIGLLLASLLGLSWVVADQGGGWASLLLPIVLLGAVLLVCALFILAMGLGAALAHWRTLRWRAFTPIVAVVLVSATWSVVYSGVLPNRYADAELERHFLSHEPQLALLAAMASAEPGDVSINDSHVSGVNEIRAAEYRNLLRQAGVNEGFYRSGSRLYFAWWELSWGVFAQQDKGYLYAPGEEPSPLLESLDGPVLSYDSSGRAYKRLSSDWYLFYFNT